MGYYQKVDIVHDTIYSDNNVSLIYFQNIMTMKYSMYEIFYVTFYNCAYLLTKYYILAM